MATDENERVWLIGTPYLMDEIYGVAGTQEQAEQIRNNLVQSSGGSTSGIEIHEYAVERPDPEAE